MSLFRHVHCRKCSVFKRLKSLLLEKEDGRTAYSSTVVFPSTKWLCKREIRKCKNPLSYFVQRIVQIGERFCQNADQFIICSGCATQNGHCVVQTNETRTQRWGENAVSRKCVLSVASALYKGCIRRISTSRFAWTSCLSGSLHNTKLQNLAWRKNAKDHKKR